MPEGGAPALRFRLPAWQAAAWAPARPALLIAGGDLSYGRLVQEADRLADALADAGIGQGQRVALLVEGLQASLFALLALWRLGAVPCPLNLRLSPAEWAAQLDRLDPARVLVAGGLAEAARLACAGRHAWLELTRPAVGTDGQESAALAPAAPCGSLDARDSAQPGEGSGPREGSRPGESVQEADPDPQAPALLLFSSGTAGSPKLVMHGHGPMTAHAGASALRLGHGPDDVWLLSLPLYHIGGIALVQRALLAGGAIALSEGGDAPAIAAALRRWPVTQLSLVPTQLARLLEVWPGPAPSGLRALLVGGAAADGATVTAARRRGWPVALTYGLTEAGSQVATGWPSRDPASGPAAPPLPGTQIEVRMPDGSPAAPGEDGEIWLRGPGLMLGYADDAAANAQALQAGWLRTGDWGSLDRAGCLTVAARREDLVVTGGENVLPAEVEGALLAHPWVAEAAVVGIDDPDWGQAVAAALVLSPAAPAEAAQDPAALAATLDAWLRGRLARFKRPRRYAVLDGLPRSESGKLLRRLVREALALPRPPELG